MTTHATKTLTTIANLRETLSPLRRKKTIVLVPTMGNLHAGHMALVQLAKQHADIVVVSIFVNPTQFGVGEDLDSYPRTLKADTEQLTAIGADFIFAPTVADMYPVMPPPTQVLTGPISQQLCGKSRPTHFDGVGLVVSKLFNIVQPHIAVFGQKDYQQLALIRQLVRDLSYDIEIISAPIVRATDGLALSSRNQYLTTSERQTAPLLHQEVMTLAQRLAKGEAKNERQLQEIIDEHVSHLANIGFKVDYLEVKQQDLSDIVFTEYGKVLESELNDNPAHQQWVILVAAWLGKARLLDNQAFEVTAA